MIMMNRYDTLMAEVHAALLETIKKKLKAQVLEAIDKEIDAAVEAAVKQLGVVLNHSQDPYMQRDLVEVVLRKETRK